MRKRYLKEFIGSDNAPISGKGLKYQAGITSVNLNPDNPELRGDVSTTDEILAQGRASLPWYMQFMMQIPVREEEMIKGVQSIDTIKDEYQQPILHNLLSDVFDILKNMENKDERNDIIKIINNELKNIYRNAKII